MRVWNRVILAALVACGGGACGDSAEDASVGSGVVRTETTGGIVASGGGTDAVQSGGAISGGSNTGGQVSPQGTGAEPVSSGGMPAAVQTGGEPSTGGDSEPATGGDSNPVDPPPDLEIPEPVAVPYVWGVGIGVADLSSAVEYYTTVMKLDIEQQNVDRGDRLETVLYPTAAAIGSRLVLMQFKDGRNTRKITAKLVWQARSPAAINRAASAYPDYDSRLTVLVYQFDGPDTYIQEVGTIFGDGGDPPWLVAMGFSVTDVNASLAFYKAAIGMESSSIGSFSVTDATGNGRIEEHSLVYPTGGGSGLVVQEWSPERNSKDNPVKVVLFVPDAQAQADSIVAAGGSIAEEAKRSPAYDNRLVILAKDPDGYMLELVQ